MAIETVFKRYEIKYIITEDQYKRLKSLFAPYMVGDEYGNSIIRNVYFDTPSYLLIRNSIDKPVYKEKLRLRGYGSITPDSTVFLEVKKKYKGVVYKRRVRLKENAAMNYIAGSGSLGNDQISREIDYFISYYKELAPKIVISYEREAFYSKTDHTFRMTFDRNILYRQSNLTLKGDAYGKKILQDGLVLMEVKTAYAIPLWLTSFLSENKIYKRSFSKYGTAYLDILSQNKKGEAVKC